MKALYSVFPTLLHTPAEEGGGTLFSELMREVLSDALVDTLKLLPFLFVTYLLMELLEHRGADKVNRLMRRSGPLGPLVGGALGAVPQCGFSAAAANLYTGRVITAGTLLAVFLSTSDEMLPMMLSHRLPAKVIFTVLGYKVAVGVLVGVLLDLGLRLLHRNRTVCIDELCRHDNCHCERGVLHSALHHTLHISLFILLVTLALNTAVFFIGGERIAAFIGGHPGWSHLFASLVGLIPNCAASVALTQFYLDGLISVGTMLAGLLCAAGVGILVLFRVNRHLKENLLLTGALLLCGFLFGLLADALGLGAFLAA